MNTEQLYIVSETLKDSFKEANVRQHISTIMQGLNNQISQPNPAHLEQVSKELKALKSSIAESHLIRIPQTWNSVIEDIDMADLIGFGIYDQVNNSIKESQPLLTDAVKNIQLLLTRIKKIENAFEQLNTSFETLGIEGNLLEEGEAELSVLLPREIFSNDFEKFLNEGKIVDRLVKTISEIEVGKPEVATVKQLSTSDPLILLGLSAVTLLPILKCIETIIDIYQKIQNIRKAKEQAIVAELSRSVIAAIEKEEKNTITLEIKKFCESFVTKQKVKDNGRRQELLTMLEKTLTQLSARIDRGMRIEGNAEENLIVEEDEDEDEARERESLNATINKIIESSEKIRYFEPAKSPILELEIDEEHDNQKK